MNDEFKMGLRAAADWIDEHHYALNGNRLGDALLAKFNLARRVRRAQRPHWVNNCPSCDNKLPPLNWGMSWNRWQWTPTTYAGGGTRLFSAYRELAHVWKSDGGKNGYWVGMVGSVAKTHKTPSQARRWCLEELRRRGERRP